MRGTPEEEASRGALDKYDTLKNIHARISPKFYLEIGVQRGRSLKLANCSAIGIDPKPQINAEEIPVSHKIFKMTSDEFFDDNSVHNSPDLVFIDGLHLFEQALKDFIHCEKISHSSTSIVIDDVFPAHPAQALRERRTQKWAGDIWKLYLILKDYREDLIIDELDVAPTGMIEVSNLDSSNIILTDHYDEIIEQYMNKELPDWIIERSFNNYA